MTKLKIALICNYPPASGIGKYAFNLHRQYALNGKVETRLFLTYYYPEIANLNEVNFLTRRRYGTVGNLENYFVLPRVTVGDYDIYHLVSHALGVFADHKSPSVVTVHDLFLLDGQMRRRKWSLDETLYLAFSRRSINKSSKSRIIIAVSNFTARQVERLLRVPRERVRVVPLGVDHSTFKPREKEICRSELGIPSSAKLILNVGVEEPRKNVSGLISVFSRIVKKVPEAMLVRIGIPSYSTLKMIEDLGLNSHVRHVSGLDEYRLALYYSAADVYCTLSYQEGFGLTALEAMASRCPTIGTEGTSLEELLGRAGIVVSPYDQEEAVSAISEILVDRIKNNRVGEDCLSNSLKYSWERCASETLSAYVDALAK